VTARGMDEADMEEISDLIYLTLSDYNANGEKVKTRVKTLLDKHPLY
jgi:glycine/serine hydroxymethyltransferase